MFFVPNISASKVGVIDGLIDKEVNRHQEHNIYACSTSQSVASKRNLKLMFAIC